MKDERRPSTEDLVAAVDRAESPEVAVRRRSDALNEVRDDERASVVAERPAPVFVQGDADGYRTRWSAIQTGFVDEPRRAVEEADALVAEVVKRLAEVFADERGRLEAIWERNDAVSTEDLRQAMRRYRSFFERLLTV